MNNIEKTFQKKEKREASKIRKWWRKYGIKIFKIVFLWPIIIPYQCYIWHKDRDYKKMSYSDSLTKKYLDKVLPSLVAWHEDSSDRFLFHTEEDYGGIHFFWAFTESRFEKKFPKQSRYFKKFNREVKQYIIDEYQVGGYTKLFLDNRKAWMEVCQRFDWETPAYGDRIEGVLFFKDVVNT